ncbi:MAG: SET domain-containing protein [Chloroflexota bacterium]
MNTSRPRSFLTPKAEVRPSSLGGNGVFARDVIAAGELVAIWGGGWLAFGELMALPDAINGYAIQVWDDLFVGPRALDEVEPSDYINHACEPNCGLKGDTVVVARRHIRSGEELTYDYGTTDALGPPMPCRCGSAGCRGRVTSDDWRDPSFRRRNAGYLSAWVQELVKREDVRGST